MYCNSLGKVYLPDSLEIIGESSFDFCEDLMEVYFPDDLKVISNNAFSQCRKLANVALPAGLEYVGDSAFSDLGDPVRSGSLDSLLIGSKLNAIGDGPFGSLPCEIFIVDPENTEFSTVDGFLTDKTGRILLACPGGRKGEVHIPEGIEIIASYAFYFCSGITDLYLPESLSYIESIAFPDEFQREDPILFHVTKGSYGYQYARSEGLDYVL